MRLIDADALLKELRKSCEYHAENSREFSLLQRDIIIVQEQPTIDAVPFETLYDFIKELGSITYGKERFFRQDNGTWYDRKHADYITLDDVIRRIVDAVNELDDSELLQRELWDMECEDD